MQSIKKRKINLRVDLRVHRPNMSIKRPQMAQPSMSMLFATLGAPASDSPQPDAAFKLGDH